MERTVTAFFSYSHRDHEADPEIVDDLVAALQAQTNASHGTRSFDIWRDAEDIRWSEKWRTRIETELARCDFLILLLSPGWLKSEICREEYRAFLDRERKLGGARIFVIEIRDVPKDDPEITDEMRSIARALRKRHAKSWRWLLDATEDERRKEYRKAGEEIAARIRALAAPQASDDDEDCEADTCEPGAHDAQRHPLVSGDYYMPRRGQEGTEATIPAHLRLTFLGRAKVETKHGRIIFAVRQASLVTEVEGGRIVDPRRDFESEWKGPRATVLPGMSGRQRQMLSISAQAGGSLSGNVLADRGESGHVRLFDVERDGSGPVKVSGSVEIELDAVRIEDVAGQVADEEEEKRRRMALKLAGLKLRGRGAPSTELEADEHRQEPPAAAAEDQDG